MSFFDDFLELVNTLREAENPQAQHQGPTITDVYDAMLDFLQHPENGFHPGGGSGTGGGSGEGGSTGGGSAGGGTTGGSGSGGSTGGGSTGGSGSGGNQGGGTGGQTQFNVINVYDNHIFSGTTGPDEFKFDAVVALQDVNGTNTQAIITNFDPAHDYLDLTLPTPDSSITDLADLNGKEGISVQYNPFDNSTVINFGNDQNGGESVTITMDGISQNEWSDVKINQAPANEGGSTGGGTTGGESGGTGSGGSTGGGSTGGNEGGTVNYNVINVYDNQTFNGTDNPDEFKFDAVAALQDVNGTNTQATIQGFDVAHDVLDILEQSADSNVQNLADLNGVDGIAVQYNPFSNATIINFGNDQNGGETVSVTLVGITQDEWSQVHVHVDAAS